MAGPFFPLATSLEAIRKFSPRNQANFRSCLRKMLIGTSRWVTMSSQALPKEIHGVPTLCYHPAPLSATGPVPDGPALGVAPRTPGAGGPVPDRPHPSGPPPDGMSYRPVSARKGPRRPQLPAAKGTASGPHHDAGSGLVGKGPGSRLLLPGRRGGGEALVLSSALGGMGPLHPAARRRSGAW